MGKSIYKRTIKYMKGKKNMKKTLDEILVVYQKKKEK